MIANNVLAFVGGACLGLAKLGRSYELVIIGRFVIGAYSGDGQGLQPMGTRQGAGLGCHGCPGYQCCREMGGGSRGWCLPPLWEMGGDLCRRWVPWVTVAMVALGDGCHG